jgi:hypothetical protein
MSKLSNSPNRNLFLRFFYLHPSCGGEEVSYRAAARVAVLGAVIFLRRLYGRFDNLRRSGTDWSQMRNARQLLRGILLQGVLSIWLSKETGEHRNRGLVLLLWQIASPFRKIENSSQVHRKL